MPNVHVKMFDEIGTSRTGASRTYDSGTAFYIIIQLSNLEHWRSSISISISISPISLKKLSTVILDSLSWFSSIQASTPCHASVMRGSYMILLRLTPRLHQRPSRTPETEPSAITPDSTHRSLKPALWKRLPKLDSMMQAVWNIPVFSKIWICFDWTLVAFVYSAWSKTRTIPFNLSVFLILSDSTRTLWTVAKSVAGASIVGRYPITSCETCESHFERYERKADVFKFFQFEERFRKALFSCQICVDGKLKDDFQSVLRSLRTLMFLNIIHGSLDGMRIDVIR